MSEPSSGDKLCLDPEKAYYLQRIDVLNECKAELLSNFKRSAWLVFIFSAIAAYLGLEALVKDRLSENGLGILEQKLAADKEFVRAVSSDVSPVIFHKVTADLEVQAGLGNSKALACPLGMVPVGGGFENSKSAVHLVQIFTRGRDLILSLDNNGGEPLVVKAWATCLQVREEQEEQSVWQPGAHGAIAHGVEYGVTHNSNLNRTDTALSRGSAG
jgi:hypothetical protein